MPIIRFCSVTAGRLCAPLSSLLPEQFRGRRRCSSPTFSMQAAWRPLWRCLLMARRLFSTCAPPPEARRWCWPVASQDGAVLTANEFSRDRKARLLSVLDQHLPESLRTQVRVTGRDASRWSRYEQSAYDRILLDAPCSSERHVLSAPSFLAGWTAARIRNLALRQWSLLSGAWLVLRPGGYLLYSTCALAPEENDLVIGRLLKKYHGVCIEETGRSDSLGEKTVYGRHVLPDTASGAGPLYYALVRKDELEV